MHRFFLPKDYITQDSIIIGGRLTHQLRSVLRLGRGDHILVLDNGGCEYEVELRTKDDGGLVGVIVNSAHTVGEPRLTVNLYQAILKGRGFELVLQKCTEIGVASFVPVLCERCVVKELIGNRLSRWRRIIVEAAQQSRRGKLPALHTVTEFKSACKSVAGVSLLPWEEEKLVGIGGALRSCTNKGNEGEVNIFIGPEGGFSAAEVEFARSYGIIPVSLGRRILRAETAGLVAAAVTLYEFGELEV